MSVRCFSRPPLLLFCLLMPLCPALLCAQQSFSLKSAPPDLAVSLNGAPLKPVSSNGAIRHYRFGTDSSGGGSTLGFSAPGYQGIEHPAAALPRRDGLVQIKLEK